MANLLGNFGPALTYEVFIHLGLVIAIPISAGRFHLSTLTFAMKFFFFLIYEFIIFLIDYFFKFIIFFKINFLKIYYFFKFNFFLNLIF